MQASSACGCSGGRDGCATPGGCAGLGHVASRHECRASGWCSRAEVGMLCGPAPWGEGLRCEGVFRGVSGCWCLPPLSLTGRAPWKPLLLWPQVLLLHAGPHPLCRPWCPSVTGLPREPSAGPPRPDCLDCALQEGARFLSGKLLQASPPRWGTPGPLGSWNEALPHPLLGPTPQGPAGSPSKPRGPESGVAEAAWGPPFVRMTWRPLLARGFLGSLVVTNPLAI